jgi:FMN phosphatase YigB (HAD superfamily)
VQQVISLDFWGTIARFNPAYAAARTAYLAELFGCAEAEASAHYLQIKHQLDARAERHGEALTPLRAVGLLIEGRRCAGEATAEDVLRALEALVRAHPPLLHPEVAGLIAALRARGALVGLASNTNFIAGALIQSIFRLPWDFEVYSDELGASKPHPRFFEAVRARAEARRPGIAPQTITHIGDNAACDHQGAERAGIRGLLTASPEQTVALLRALLLAMPTGHRLAVHRFSSLEGAPFDVGAYSRLKFGADRVARRFGQEMAEAFFAAHRALLRQPCVVIPAPSTTVPVAATLLSRHFTDRLNALLTREGDTPVEWTQIHRNVSYNDNYASLPSAERRRLLAIDRLYINRGFVAGKLLLFIDDCSITGAHEDKLRAFLAEEGLDNPHAFICYARYEGADATIELRLNHAAVKDARDLVALAAEPDHRVTTRALRLLLEHPEADFDALLRAAPARFVEDSFHAAIVKHYHRHGPYAANFNRLAARCAMQIDAAAQESDPR